MTRKELIALIKPLTWRLIKAGDSHPPQIRTPEQACPILAAFALKFPKALLLYGNAEWEYAARQLGLPLRIAEAIVKDADCAAPRLRKELGLTRASPTKDKTA